MMPAKQTHLQTAQRKYRCFTKLDKNVSPDQENKFFLKTRQSFTLIMEWKPKALTSTQNKIAFVRLLAADQISCTDNVGLLTGICSEAQEKR